MPWTNRTFELYHGTTGSWADDILNRGVVNTRARKGLDFGPGFYTTTVWKQAARWANKQSGECGTTPGIVRFTCNYSELSRLRAIHFPRSDRASEEYWKFVLLMKGGSYGRHAASEGLFELAIGSLAIKPGKRTRFVDSDQYSFHGEEGFKFINACPRTVVRPANGFRF